MADLGEPTRIIEVEPLENPVPQKLPEEIPTEPLEIPEGVPA